MAIKRKMRTMMTGLGTSKKQEQMARPTLRLAVNPLKMAIKSLTTMMRKAMGRST